MASKRDYKVKGTKDFLVLAGIFFFLCIWAIKDAWYPSPSVLDKHPLQLPAAFEMDGSVGKVYVSVGDHVAENQVLAELRSGAFEKAFEAAKQDYAVAKKAHAQLEQLIRTAPETGAEVAPLRAQLAEAANTMDAALERVSFERGRMDMTELRAPVKGVIEEIAAEPLTLIKAGEPAVVVHPDDHFYLFNKSLAIFSFIAFWVFLGIHVLAR